MKLHTTIANEYHSDIQIRDEGTCVFAEIDGRNYQLNVHESGTGKHLIISDGQVFDCLVEGRPESGKPSNVTVGTLQFAVTITDPKRLRGVSDAGSHAAEAAQILAAMPGKVVRILVEVGAQVEAGASIAVVEAMKMQNELKSPKAGAVTSVNVQAGQTVNAGDVLAVVE
jgi:biotin carboxyl carrier protein